MQVDSQFLTLNEAAALLRCSRPHVLRHLPTVRIGRRVLIRRSDVERAIQGAADAQR